MISNVKHSSETFNLIANSYSDDDQVMVCLYGTTNKLWVVGLKWSHVDQKVDILDFNEILYSTGHGTG